MTTSDTTIDRAECSEVTAPCIVSANFVQICILEYIEFRRKIAAKSSIIVAKYVVYKYHEMTAIFIDVYITAIVWLFIKVKYGKLLI